MRQLLVGLLVGAVLGSGVTVAASYVGPRITGQSGYSSNVDVKVNRVKICSDPWIWIEGSHATIECN